MFHSAPVGVELVARDATRPNPTRHGPQLSLADQGADLFLGAAELESNVSDCQGIRLLHTRSIAPMSFRWCASLYRVRIRNRLERCRLQ